MNKKEEDTALADEIEESAGLFCISHHNPNGGHQLGIKKTAQVIATLRASAVLPETMFGSTALCHHAMMKINCPECSAAPSDGRDLSKRPFAFAVRRAPENGADEWRLFRDEGEALEAAEQLDGDYEGLYRVGDRRSALPSDSRKAEPVAWRDALERISKEVFTDGTPTKAAKIAIAALS